MSSSNHVNIPVPIGIECDDTSVRICIVVREMGNTVSFPNGKRLLHAKLIDPKVLVPRHLVVVEARTQNVEVAVQIHVRGIHRLTTVGVLCYENLTAPLATSQIGVV